MNAQATSPENIPEHAYLPAHVPGIIAAPGQLWFASDIHLGPDIPATCQAFYRFLERARSKADGLVLLGDLFEAWIGDDHALHDPEPWLQQALHELRETAKVMPLWIARGNRDFLMGERLVRHLGATLLQTPCIMQTDAGRVLLAHGDEYCIDDKAYQRFRRIVHTSWIQDLFLALPLAARRTIASTLRKHSRETQASVRLADVNPAGVHKAMQLADCRIMVHGHTHRPAVHPLQVNAEPAWRYVLPDWDMDRSQLVRGGWLEIGSACAANKKKPAEEPAIKPVATEPFDDSLEIGSTPSGQKKGADKTETEPVGPKPFDGCPEKESADSTEEKKRATCSQGPALLRLYDED